MQLETAVDLLADETERATRREPKAGEQLVEKAFESQTSRLGVELGDLNEQRRKFLGLRLTQRRRRLPRRLPRLYRAEAAEKTWIKQLGDFELDTGKKDVQPINLFAA